jgi:hypothetical protein
MSELQKRRAPRYKVAKAGIIKFDNRTVDCLVRSLSETGAGMDVVNQQFGIPSKFELIIPGDGIIPHLIDQNPCAHWRSPMDMIFHGRSTSVFQA